MNEGTELCWLLSLLHKIATPKECLKVEDSDRETTLTTRSVASSEWFDHNAAQLIRILLNLL